MSVLDDWRDLSRGRVRIETGEPDPDERTKLRQGSVLIVIGFTVLAVAGDYWLAVFAMSIAGVFVQLLAE